MADETPGTTPGEVIGHAEPDTGQGEAATSEIPEGVDALSDEQIQAAEERGGGGEDGDSGALDMADIVAGGAPDAEGAEGGAADETGDDAEVKTDPEAQVAPDTGATDADAEAAADEDA